MTRRTPSGSPSRSRTLRPASQAARSSCAQRTAARGAPSRLASRDLTWSVASMTRHWRPGSTSCVRPRATTRVTSAHPRTGRRAASASICPSASAHGSSSGRCVPHARTRAAVSRARTKRCRTGFIRSRGGSVSLRFRGRALVHGQVQTVDGVAIRGGARRSPIPPPSYRSSAALPGSHRDGHRGQVHLPAAARTLGHLPLPLRGISAIRARLIRPRVPRSSEALVPRVEAPSGKR